MCINAVFILTDAGKRILVRLYSAIGEELDAVVRRLSYFLKLRGSGESCFVFHDVGFPDCRVLYRKF